MNLSRLIYVSQAVRPFTPLECENLLIRSRARNKGLKITGLLLTGGGHFLQVLEGPLSIVADRFDAIRLDPRHQRVQRLVFEFAGKRMFPMWWMGAFNVDELTALNRERLARFIELSRQGPGVTQADAVLALLREFELQVRQTKNTAA